MSDIKTLLKEARKLIDDQKYLEAQECCKNILRKDKNNYLGLVLLGKSFQDSEQATMAYQKAIASKPDHLLAWQGLANYYETKNDQAKLCSIYTEMINLITDDDKGRETIVKLVELGCILKNSNVISCLVKYILKNPDSKLYDISLKLLIELLKAEVPCKSDDISQILLILDKIRSVDPTETESVEILYAKVILQKNNFASAVKEIIGLEFFSHNVLLREELCKYLCTKYIENNSSFLDLDTDKYFEQITNGVENSKYPGLLRSMVSYDKSLYSEAFKQCIPLINYNEADVTEVTFILRCTVMLKKWSVTQKLAENFLAIAKDEIFRKELRKFLFLSLAMQKKWIQAINVAKQIPIADLNKDEQAMLAECCIENGDDADHLLETLQYTEHYVCLRALQLFKMRMYSEIPALIEQATEQPINLFYLGKAYWELKEYDKAHVNLLKAAKLDSEHAETFLYLGHLYQNYKQDLEKAKKCYEKAYNLNDYDNNTAKSLSGTYCMLGLYEKDFGLLNSSLNKVQTSETWIQFRLGLHYSRRKEWENAIIHFRSVIKSDHSNTTAFECLADAYYARGSFTSALRVYNKVMALDPKKSCHCLTRIGYIYSLLTQYNDAIVTFEKVLKIDPNSILALKGIGETWMKIAKKKFTTKMFGSARDCADFAINYIKIALKKQQRTQFKCLWKILADCLMLITKLPNKYCYVYSNTLIDDTNLDTFQMEKVGILQQAIACYSHIAKQNDEFALYDLASSYLKSYSETKDLIHCNVSFNLALICLKRKPNLWRNWNLLGKICIFIKKYEISQHCFIKALLVTRKWSVATIWCNLGSLYLMLKLYKLANYCYWRGQSTQPSYPHSWIGQGLIAETLREEEAMDLFRHASRLGYSPESALGYADWVCRTLKNNKSKGDPEFKYVIKGLYAIEQAIDLLEWFSTFESNNACAFTILGILQERCGLIRAAFKSYEKALQFAEDKHKNIARLNMGRILVRMENYDEAIKVYKDISEASLNSTCGLALALYKKGLYEESYSAYDTALNWLSNDDVEKADLLVAMAGIVYMFKGPSDAKTLLFHSIQVSQKKPTVHSLFAICSLGLIHSDQSLSKLALSELQKFEKEGEFASDIGFLKSYLFITENNTSNVLKILSNALHNHPSNSVLWFYIAEYCLTQPFKAKLASNCARRALITTTYTEGECNSSKMLATASIAENNLGDHVKALNLAKQGLRIYPDQGETWAALLFSLLAHKMWTEKKDWILTAASRIRRHMDITRSLSRWVSLIEKKLGK